MRPSLSSFFAAAFLASAVGCQPAEPDLCDHLAAQCGGDHAENWHRWCRSECVPEAARTVSCPLNDQCVLCDEPREDGNTTLFALPSDELEYMWTLTDDEREPIHPPSEPAPTGAAFVDGIEPWAGEGTVGAWRAYDPFPRLHPFAPEGFCEPGPNRFIADNVVGTAGALVLRAQRMPGDAEAPFCPDGRCVGGPYSACEMPPTGCQYREEPDAFGLGYASQADRIDESGTELTYGYGRYRSTFKTAGDTTIPQPGFVYAFFTQGNQACVDGTPNFETNTSEVDVELSSGGGEAGGEPFCVPGEMCLQVSTWVSSTQGIADYAGVLRHQVSGFRFRDPAIAAGYRTYGWDWQPTDVRFTYDRDPGDCDEQAGGCGELDGSLAICRHLRFVPRRPSPIHFQVWNAWWAGDVARGATAEMSIERVWHEPVP